MILDIKSKFLVMIIGLSVFVNLFAADASKDAAYSGFQFLEEPTTPSLIGVAYSGGAIGGMGGFFYNPAKYSFVDDPSFHLEFGRYKNWDANKVNFELAVPISKAFISYGMRVFAVDGIQRVDEFGDLPHGSASERAVTLSLGSGLNINKYINFGLDVSAVIHNLVDDYAYSMMFGVGALGSPIPGKLNIGLSIVNFGVTTGMAKKKETFGDGERLPTNSRLAIAWMDTLKTVDYKLLFDIVYRNVRDRDDDFTHRISDRFTFPLGVEVKPVAPLALRVGKRINFSSEIINLGVGLITEAMDFDFGLVVNKLVDDAEPDWTASFTYRLIKKEKKSKVKKESVDLEKQEIIVKDTVDTLKIEIDKDSTKADSVNVENLSLDSSESDTSLLLNEKSDSISVEQKSDSVSTESDSVSTESDSVSTESDSVSTESDSVSTESDSVSTESDSVSTESDSVSTESDSVSTESDSVSTESDSVSTNNATIDTTIKSEPSIIDSSKN